MERALEMEHSPGRRFPWRGLGIMSALVMELAVIVGWMRLLLASVNPPPAWLLLLWCLGIAALGRQVAHWVADLDLRSSVASVGSGVLLLAAVLLSLNLVYSPDTMLNLVGAAGQLLRALPQMVPPAGELLLALTIILVWRRGIASAASGYLAPGTTGFKFRLGVLVFAVFTVVTRQREGAIPELMPTFFVAGLLAMSIGRAYWLTRLRGAGEPPFTVGWIGSLLALFGLTVAAGVAVGRLMDHPLAHQALAGVRELVLEFLGLVYLLMLPLLIAIEPWLQRLLAAIRNLLAGSPIFLEDTLEAQQEQAEAMNATDPPAFFQSLSEFLTSLQAYWPIARALLIGLAVVLVVFFALRLRRQRRRLAGAKELPRDEGEDLFERRGAGGLTSVVESVRSWGRALLEGELRTAIVVRRTYARLLNLAQAMGRGRHRWETPLEFERALGGLLPDMEAEVGEITDAYVKVRYGMFEQTEGMVDEVRSAWKRIERHYG